MRACAHLDLGDYYDFSWISFTVDTGDMLMGTCYEYRFMRGQGGCPWVGTAWDLVNGNAEKGHTDEPDNYPTRCNEYTLRLIIQKPQLLMYMTLKPSTSQTLPEKSEIIFFTLPFRNEYL